MTRPRRAAALLLGLVFLATATGKLLDNRGFADVLQTYRLGDFPPWFWLAAALALSLAELATGIALLAGQRAGIVGAATLSTVGLAATLSALARGLALQNCGCFGAFWPRPLGPTTPLEDVVLILLALFAWPTRTFAR